MSTTRGAPQGVVRMIDPPDVVRKKFKTAVTDSGTDVRHDPEEKPGVSNLIEIMAVATGTSIADVESQFDGQGYGAFKEASPRRSSSCSLRSRSATRSCARTRASCGGCSRVGAEKAREASAPTLEAMYERMGFVRP